jgi:hypothetical protein
MKTLAFLLLSSCLWAQINLDTMSAGCLAKITLTNQYPQHGADVKFGVDTSGFAYMFGGCTYGGAAEGTHNADVFRFNIATGRVDRLYDNSNAPQCYGCQAYTAYDPTRNCMWFGNSAGNTVANTCKVFKFQCPDGPITKYSDSAIGGCWSGAMAQYAVYDPVHDLLIGVGPGGLSLFYISTRKMKTVTYPFGSICGFEIPNCWDSKRGLLALTLVQTSWDPTYDAQHPACNIRDIWFFNPADTSWSHKTPTNIPPIYRCEMAYDSRNDKYIYYGSGFSFWFEHKSCETQIWAYDPGSNAWEQISQNGRAYNSHTPDASTWPANRMKGAFGYSEKYNVCVNWGGCIYGGWGGYDTFPTLDITTMDSCMDLAQQPLWLFRYGTGGSPSEKNAGLKAGPFSAFPNPFIPSTRIALPADRPASSAWSLRIFSLDGKLVRDLTPEANMERRGNGRTVVWNGRDNRNSAAQSGVYLCVLRNGIEKRTLKLTLMK